MHQKREGHNHIECILGKLLSVKPEVLLEMIKYALKNIRDI